ncbi:MAG: hypothetical protein M3O30_07825 [Planctomycetota bacterium]|nr:hypothetical protein [Planctomycetota bacterium]
MSTLTAANTITILPKRSPAIGFSLLVGLLALVAVAKVVLADTLDPDCFWHLRVADEIARQGWPRPLIDHLSFASIPRAWVPYSWLAELAMKRLWDLGGYRAAVAAQAAMEAGFLLFIAMGAIEGTRVAFGEPRYFASALATAMAAVLSLAYLSFRPVTAVLLLLAVVSWLLLRDRRMEQKSRAVWLVPLLTALATNFHLFAIFVPLWTVALFVGDLIEQRRELANRRVGRGAALASLSTLGFLMTPLLPGAVRSIVNYSLNDIMVRSRVISEMQPFYHGVMGWVSAGLVVMLFVLLARRYFARPRKTLGLGEFFWLAGSAVLLLRIGRMAPVFALIASPWFAVVMPTMSDRILTRSIIWGMLGAVLFAGAIRIAGAFPRESMSISTWLNRHGAGLPAYPCAAADFVEQHVAPVSGRLICEFSWGGYLEWRLGNHYQTLMDGRTQLFSADFWRSAYMGSMEDRARLLKSTGADVAVIPRQRSLFLKTLQDLNWQTVYEDDFATVLIPPAK